MKGFFVVCLIASRAFATSIDVAVDPQCVLDAAAEGARPRGCTTIWGRTMSGSRRNTRFES